MKKLVSLLLALLLLTSVVVILPAFPAAADVEDTAESTGTSDPDAYSLTLMKERIYVKNDSIKLMEAPSDDAKFTETLNTLFDGDRATTGRKFEGNWGDSSKKLVVAWETEEPTTIFRYMVYTGNDAALYPGRNPDGWILYGSQNGSDYQILDQVDNAGLENLDNLGHLFEIASPTPYQYYKIEIIKRDAGHFQLNEIEFYSDTDTESSYVEVSDEYRYELPVSSFTPKDGCGFIDSDMLFGKYGLSRILGTTDSKEILDQTKVYINGEEARFNNGYLGYVHCTRNSSDGYLLGVVGAGYTKGEPTTVTLLIGDYFYATANFTPGTSALAVESSKTVYHSVKKTCVSSVTFAEPTDFKVGGEISARLHDDHNDRVFRIESVSEDRKTVTFVCDDFSTAKSLLEFKISDELRFSVTIDEEIDTVTETAVGYLQTRKNAEDPAGKLDSRIIIETNENFIQNYDSATMKMDYTLADGSLKSFTAQITTAYRKISAGSEIYTATQGCALFGVVVVGVPMGTERIAATVTFQNSETGENHLIDLGAASLSITTEEEVSTVKAMTKYGSDRITVTATDDGRPLDDGEGAMKLFDGTTAKHGTGNLNFSVSFKTQEAVTVSGIIFTIANDTYASGSSRTYRSWTLLGEDKEGNWWVVAVSNKPITTGTSAVADNVDPDTVDDSNREAYVIENAGRYSSYKLEVTGGGGYTQMGEITLYVS